MATINFLIPDDQKTAFLEELEKSGCKNQSEFLQFLLDFHKSNKDKQKLPGVRAKFVCNKIEELVSQEEKQVFLSVVVDGSDENKSFSRWTPSGALDMIISNETAAGDLFEENQEYYLDISKAVTPVFDFEPATDLSEEEKANAEEIELTDEEMQIASKKLKSMEEKPKRFKMLAIIDGSIQKPIIEAANEADARKQLKEKHPHATIHTCTLV